MAKKPLREKEKSLKDRFFVSSFDTFCGQFMKKGHKSRKNHGIIQRRDVRKTKKQKRLLEKRSIYAVI